MFSRLGAIALVPPNGKKVCLHPLIFHFFPLLIFFKYVAFCTGFNLLTPIFMLPYIIMDLPIFERGNKAITLSFKWPTKQYKGKMCSYPQVLYYYQQKNRLLLDTENLKARISFRNLESQYTCTKPGSSTVQQTMAKREKLYFNNLADIKK